MWEKAAHSSPWPGQCMKHRRQSRERRETRGDPRETPAFSSTDVGGAAPPACMRPHTGVATHTHQHHARTHTHRHLGHGEVRCPGSPVSSRSGRNWTRQGSPLRLPLKHVPGQSPASHGAAGGLQGVLSPMRSEGWGSHTQEGL